MKRTTFVGLDVHKRWINVAVLLPGQDTSIEWRIVNEPQAIRRMLKRVADLSLGDVRYCYEAGPCGYALQRQIISWSDASCMLVPPSLIPRKPGERIKTDRRDARKLAQLFRAGLLTEVHPLTEEDKPPGTSLALVTTCARTSPAPVTACPSSCLGELSASRARRSTSG